MSSVEELHRRKREWRKAGLCYSCGSATEPGHKLCTEHLAYHRDFKKNARASRLAAGVCIQCGTDGGMDGGQLCARCRAATNERARKRRELRAEQAARLERNAATWRERQREAGLCVIWVCGRRAGKGSDRCKRHSDPTHKPRHHRKLVAAHREKRLADGRCWQCGMKRERLEIQRCNDCAGESVRTYVERKLERRAAGLCLCGRRPKGEFANCAKCRAHGRKREAERRARRVAAGLCTRCPRKAEGTLCDEHREAAARDSQRRARISAGRVLKEAA